MTSSFFKKSIHNSKFIIQKLALLALLILTFTGCVKYGLSGGDTGSAKTLTVRYFTNEAAGPPNLGQIFTEKLRDYYQINSKLNQVNESGDWILEGRIVTYTVTPVSPTGAGTTALNRLTISVNLNFINNMEGPNEVKSFESVFSFYEDFSQTQNLSQVEADLIDTILNRIVFDIFNRTTSNW